MGTSAADLQQRELATVLAGQRHFVSAWARNAKKNLAFGLSFTPVVLVLNEVVLVLLLDIARETWDRLRAARITLFLVAIGRERRQPLHSARMLALLFTPALESS